MQAIKHLLLSVFALLLGSPWGFGATVVKIAGCSGAPGAPAQLLFSLSEVDPGVTALEVDLAIPSASVAYSGGAATDARLGSTHAVQAGVRDGHLRIALYSASLAPLTPGALCSVPLQLLPEPGHFPLVASALASTAGGEGVEVSVNSPEVSVLAAKLQLGAFEVDYGRVPIRSTHTANVVLRNLGTVAANISASGSSTPELCFANLPATLGAGEEVNLTVNYAPTLRAPSWQGKIWLESDATNPRLQLVAKGVPFSVNEFHLDFASGLADTEVPLSLRFNNMEPIVAMDVEIPLPEGIEYVEGSAILAKRAPNHSLAVSFNPSTRVLRLVMHNMQNLSVNGSDGLIATLKLKPIGAPGYYWLEPKALLANVAGENMTSATSGNYISVTAPSLQAESAFALGHGAVTAPHRRSFAVSNYGSASLKVERVSFLAEGWECTSALPLVVEPWNVGYIEVQCNGTAGEYATTMNIYTNDPLRRLHPVAVSASLYEPNDLTLASEPGVEGLDCRFSLGLDNYTPIRALQFDIQWNSDFALTSADLERSSRLSDHVAMVARVAPDRHRVVLYSPTNAPILPGEGEILALRHSGATDFTTPVRLFGMVLTSDGSANLLSPGAGQLEHWVLPIPVEEIALSDTELALIPGTSATVWASLLPANATFRTVSWSTSDPSVATVENVAAPVETTASMDGSSLPSSMAVSCENVSSATSPAYALVKAVGAGTAIITASVPGGFSASFPVRVSGGSSLTAPSVDAVSIPETLFDLQGRPVANPTPGLYLTSTGRKVVVK